MQQLIDRHTSTGNQLKWLEDNKYFKQDTYGYEALSEYVASFILGELQLMDYVPYYLSDKGICYSYNFLEEGDTIVTIDNILTQTMTVKDFKYFERKSLRDRFELVCDRVVDFTGLECFRDYFIKLLHIDFIILNDDRHFNNIALINSMNTFKLCPVFDNGASFLSNIIRYPYEISIKENIQRIKSKPISTSFLRQLDLVLSLSKFHIDIEKLNNVYNKLKLFLTNEPYYTELQHNRVLYSFLQQIRTYEDIVNQGIYFTL